LDKKAIFRGKFVKKCPDLKISLIYIIHKWRIEFTKNKNKKYIYRKEDFKSEGWGKK